MKYSKIFLILSLVGVLLSCTNKSKTESEREQNTVKIAIDETFRPVMEQELFAFHLKHPEAILDSSFVPETDAINLLLQDSVRNIIATRPLTAKEMKQITDAHQLVAQYREIAYDAIALIVNKANTDTLISVSQVQKILNGHITNWNQISNARTKGDIELVFDNENSSTVRFMRDSVNGGKDFQNKHLKSAGSNKNVINYVAQTRNAIGIIGVDWIRNTKDTTNLSFDKHINVMSVSSSSVAEESNSFLPFQYYIATADYPFIRKLYVITTDPRTQSMGLNFFYFLTDTEGQTIVTKSSQLLPVIAIQIKNVHIND